MLVTRILSFSHNVFKRFFSNVIKSQDCVVKSNPLLKGNTVGLFKFADDKINLTEEYEFVSERIAIIVGNTEIADYQHFFSYPTMFSKSLFVRMDEGHHYVLTLYHTISTFNNPEKENF